MSVVETASTMIFQLTKNDSVEIPAGYYIHGIIFLPDPVETISSLKVGMSALDALVVTAFDLNDGTEYVCKTPSDGYRCWASATDIHFTATTWPSGSEITVTVLMQKLNGV